MTLTEFLLARIEDDEKVARLVSAESPTAVDRTAYWASRSGADTNVTVVTVDYQRLLAECEAKRQIIRLAYEATGYDLDRDLERRSDAREDSGLDYVGERILRALALPYRSHPDHDEGWAAETDS
ncbi:DUF6221 family protein [Oerskovia sp. M15]